MLVNVSGCSSLVLLSLASIVQTSYSMAMSACCSNPATCGSGPMASEYIPRLEQVLVDCMSKLPTKTGFASEDAGPVAKLIYDSMTTSGRVYHSMQHVFDISKTMEDPILLLSALFHDVIYYSIDKKFNEDQTAHLEGVLQPDTQQLSLAATFADPLVDLVVRLYGFTPGEELPKSGTNEFLSAMIGVRALSKWLGNSHLMEIATCIEATIPFRPVSDDGKSPMDRLYDRLKAVCPEESEDWLVATVHKAAVTANCDLCSFDSTDRDFFLDSSWRLIPEARPSLLADDCPLSEYADEMNALAGRTKFLMSAVPKIFQSFRGVPSEKEMAEKQRMTHENLAIMCEFSKVRQLQAMVLVEFACAMGADPKTLPLRSCLTMDVPLGAEGSSDSLTSQEKEVRSWLVGGRRACFSWDPAISPLGALLFDSLGTKGVSEAIEIGKNQAPGSHELLKYLPKSAVCTVASRLGTVFTDRADRLAQIPEKLGILAQ